MESKIVETLISINNLCFYVYDEDKKISYKILDNINLDIKKGEFVVILGKNGSGKSTLIKHLNAILTPTSGDVIVDGINTKEEKRICDIRQKIGMVFQNPDNQIVSDIVEEDVAFGAENLCFTREKILKNVETALKRVGLYDFRKMSCNMLSGGQKQRIAIAGVLAMDTICLVLDEPTSMLDPKGRKEVLDTLVELNKKGTTIVMITHNLEEVFFADRVFFLESGKLAWQGIPKDLFSYAEYSKKIGLGVTQILDFIYRLRDNGYPLPVTINEEECAVNVCKFLKKME